MKKILSLTMILVLISGASHAFDCKNNERKIYAYDGSHRYVFCCDRMNVESIYEKTKACNGGESYEACRVNVLSLFCN